MKVRRGFPWLAGITALGLTLLILRVNPPSPPADSSAKPGSKAPPSAEQPAALLQPSELRTEAPPAESPTDGIGANPEVVKSGHRVLCIVELPRFALRDETLRVSVAAEEVVAGLVSAPDGTWQGQLNLSDDAPRKKVLMSALVESDIYAHRRKVLPLSEQVLESGGVRFEFELDVGASLHLFVVDELAMSASDAVVWLRLRGAGESPEPNSTTVASRRAMTDSHGRVTLLGMEPGDWVVDIAGQKWWEDAPRQLVVAQVGNQEWNRIVVPRLADSQYVSGFLHLPSGLDWRDVCLVQFETDGTPLGDRIPCYEGGAFYAHDPDSEGMILRAEITATGRRSKPWETFGGSHGVLVTVEWEE